MVEKVRRKWSSRSYESGMLQDWGYDGCLRTLVAGIKPFIVRLGVKILMTYFPARPLRSSLNVMLRLSGMLLPMTFYMGVEGRLRVVIS